MSAKSGPSIVTSNLILHYDLGNEDSYLGEPTVNLLASWMNSASSSLGAWADGGGTGSASISADPLVGFKVRLTKTNSAGRYAINNGSATSATVKKTHSCLIRKVSATTGALLIFYTDYYTPTRYAVGVYVNLDNMTFSSLNTVENATITNVFRDWYLVKYTTTFTDCTSGSHNVWISTQPAEVELAKYQLENKDHYTNYVNGTRSSTDAIKDLSGNNYHASFYSAAQFLNQRPYYPNDSSNGQIGTQISSAASSNLNLGTGDITVEVWLKLLDGSTTSRGVFTHGANGGGGGYGIYLSTNGTTQGEVYGPSGGRQTFSIGSALTSNVYNQLVYIFSVPDLKVYVYKNGVYSAQFSFLSTGAVTSPYANAHFGTSHGDYFRGLVGVIDILRVYKRKLTATEIANNYNAVKSRFGL